MFVIFIIQDKTVTLIDFLIETEFKEIRASGLSGANVV